MLNLDDYAFIIFCMNSSYDVSAKIKSAWTVMYDPDPFGFGWHGG
jgi:hypothetical protein